MALQETIFYIDEEIFCFWDKDPIKTNLEFIDRFDDEYFEFIANHASNILESDTSSKEDKSYMSIILRNTYSHALESFFAFVCASIQATDFIPGWLLKYRTTQLYSLVEKIQGNNFIHNKLMFDKVNWEVIVGEFFCMKSSSKTKIQDVKNKFELLWKRLATDFLNTSIQAEYNSIKHGFRVEEGGFHINFSAEDKPGQISKRNEVKSLGGSKFGSSFYIPEKLSNKKPHYAIHRNSRNWPLKRYARELVLISLSLKNIKSYLKIKNGENPEEQKFIYPQDLSFLDMYLADNPGVLEFNLHTEIKTEEHALWSKSALKQVYDKMYYNKKG